MSSWPVSAIQWKSGGKMTSKNSSGAGKSVASPGTLLIVDDEPNVLSALRRLFRPHGYQILLAESGKKALEILSESNVDLVISDMRMPGMDGAEFLSQAARRWPDMIRILLTGQADLDATIRVVNEGHISRYVSKPWDDEELVTTVQRGLEQRYSELERRRLVKRIAQYNEELKTLNQRLAREVVARREEAAQSASFEDMSHQELKDSYLTAIPVFANLVDMREGASKGHGRRVADLARCIAERMELKPQLVQDIYHAGLLHDAGKIGLPDPVVEKPFSALNSKERKQLEAHSVLGEAVLLALEPLHDTARLIRGHHESYNGTGYPDRLAGEKIPLGARILRVANDFDAAQVGHLVERTVSAAEARALIEKHSGQLYDPEVAVVALEVLESEKGRFQVDTGGEIRIDSGSLREGMVLMREVVNPSGILLLPVGNCLTTAQIQRLHEFEHDADRRFVYYVQREEGEIVAE